VTRSSGGGTTGASEGSPGAVATSRPPEEGLDDEPSGVRRPLPAEGFFGPGSMAWRLNREALLLLGAGPRALLLQIAHPLIAEGVEAHSRFRQDPWGRLVATLTSFLRLVYGAGPAADAEVHRLARVHRPVRGQVQDPVARGIAGPTYDARDPELILWVHATLVDSTLAAYEAWIRPLSEAERRQFYDETRTLGLALGIPAHLLPEDLAAFRRYVARMLAPNGPVHVTPTARRLAEAILHPPLGGLHAALRPLDPLLDRLPPPLYDWLLWPALGLLPAPLRVAYGIPWGWRQRLVAAWLVGSWRLWRPLIPAPWRSFGVAERAARCGRLGDDGPALAVSSPSDAP
jgi:uncharacterized protein (DUF2236 family)